MDLEYFPMLHPMFAMAVSGGTWLLTSLTTNLGEILLFARLELAPGVSLVCLGGWRYQWNVGWAEDSVVPEHPRVCSSGQDARVCSWTRVLVCSNRRETLPCSRTLFECTCCPDARTCSVTPIHACPWLRIPTLGVFEHVPLM